MSGFISVSSGGLPIGSKIEVFSKVVPKGYLLCDGSRVSKTQYAKLYSVIQDEFMRLTNEYGDVITQDSTKFWLPEFRDSTFSANGRKKYNDIVEGGVGGIPANINIKYDTRYIASVTRTINSFSASTLIHATKTTGKYYIPVRIKNVILPNNNDETDFSLGFNYGGVDYAFQISFKNESGVLKQKNFYLLDNGVVKQNLALNVVFNRPEVYFFVDLIAKTAGVIINGTTYNFSWPVPTVASYQLCSLVYCLNAGASIEVGYLPISEMSYGAPIGYTHLLELSTPQFIFNEKLGGSTHSHTVGGTVLTINQIPPHDHDVTNYAGKNGATNRIDAPVASGESGTLTGQRGGGQAHDHTLTTASSLPPHITTMFAIKYK